MAKIEVHETEVAGQTGVILVVAPEMLDFFRQVIEKGMAFEFGQPAQLYDLTDRLRLVKS